MATKANLTIDQGATFNTVITLTDNNGDPISLSGYSGAAQMRKHYTSSTAVSFSVGLGGDSGTITLGLSANATANISAGRYLYDVEITDAEGLVSRVFEGIVSVNPNITR
jgi:hypothetical protein